MQFDNTKYLASAMFKKRHFIISFFLIVLLFLEWYWADVESICIWIKQAAC